MNIEQFRAERVYNPDLRTAVSDISDVYDMQDDECPGYVYPGLLVIDGAEGGEQFCCTIANDSRLGTLAELEEWLFEYGQSERLFDDVDSQ